MWSLDTPRVRQMPIEDPRAPIKVKRKVAGPWWTLVLKYTEEEAETFALDEMKVCWETVSSVTVLMFNHKVL